MVKYWTIEEDRILKDNYLGLSYSDLSLQLPGRSIQAIGSRIRQLGLSSKSTIWTNKWTTDECNILRDNYYSSSLADLCKLLPERSRNAISKKARCLGFVDEFGKKSPELWSEDEIAVLKQNYNKMTCAEMSRSVLLGRDKNAICGKAGKLIRKGELNKKRIMNFVDDFFFSSINEKSAYWAGFIAADGCVDFSRPCISISLSSKDEKHLLRPVSDTRFSGKLTRFSVNKKNYIRLSIRSKQWVEDLEQNYNVIPRKTLIYKPPIFEDEKIVKSFLSGYIDGDGNIYKNKGGLWYLRVLGTYEMMIFVKEWFDYWAPLLRRDCKITAVKSIFQYHVGGSRATRILDQLLTADVPRLKRKWSVFEQEYLG